MISVIPQYILSIPCLLVYFFIDGILIGASFLDPDALNRQPPLPWVVAVSYTWPWTCYSLINPWMFLRTPKRKRILAEWVKGLWPFHR